MNTNVCNNPQLPIIGKELLRKVAGGEITMQEFDKECAYWMMGDISTMFHKYDRIDKPDVIKDYEANRARDINYRVEASFWQRDDVRAYTDQSHKVININRANWYWLHFMQKHIMSGDTINQAKISRAIESYPKG